jgi:predicted nuclease with TOPRIM domain
MTMSWFETLTKETFVSFVREAMKEDLSELKQQNQVIVEAVHLLAREVEAIKLRLIKLEEIVGKLEYQVDRLRESNAHFADRVGRLEGTLEGSLRGITADLKLDLYEKFRGELPAKASSRKKTKRVAA